MKDGLEQYVDLSVYVNRTDKSLADAERRRAAARYVNSQIPSRGVDSLGPIVTILGLAGGLVLSAIGVNYLGVENINHRLLAGCAGALAGAIAGFHYSKNKYIKYKEDIDKRRSEKLVDICLDLEIPL